LDKEPIDRTVPVKLSGVFRDDKNRPLTRLIKLKLYSTAIITSEDLTNPIDLFSQGKA
jgi:hypothetical protein